MIRQVVIRLKSQPHPEAWVIALTFFTLSWAFGGGFRFALLSAGVILTLEALVLLLVAASDSTDPPTEPKLRKDTLRRIATRILLPGLGLIFIGLTLLGFF